jgi:hypothetical protein
VPPEIKARSFANQETIEVGTSGVEVFVVAQDGDDDRISFVWSYANGDLIGDAEYFVDEVDGDAPDRQTSLVNVPWDPELDGEELRCDVFDEENDTLTLSWPLEVL